MAQYTDSTAEINSFVSKASEEFIKALIDVGGHFYSPEENAEVCLLEYADLMNIDSDFAFRSVAAHIMLDEFWFGIPTEDLIEIRDNLPDFMGQVDELSEMEAISLALSHVQDRLSNLANEKVKKCSSDFFCRAIFCVQTALSRDLQIGTEELEEMKRYENWPADAAWPILRAGHVFEQVIERLGTIFAAADASTASVLQKGGAA